MKNNRSEKKQKKTDTNFLKRLVSNPWRLAFLFLVALIFGCGLFVSSRIFETRNAYIPKEEVSKASKPAFQINFKKNQVNQMVNYMFGEEVKKSGMDYRFILDNDALLEGSFPILGHETKFYLYFDPYVIKNGNFQLRAKELSIGTLNVPISAVINYISNSMAFPEWVEMNPKKQYITLHLDQLKFKDGLKVKADKINLIDDEIVFNVYLPKKK
ncbi:YpmS family protein [Vagococcus sp.]|uniref:YpmS family protein n=1 Tax=Vagococcus sp. TaxID=1933889 RepID=UPI003F9609AC